MILNARPVELSDLPALPTHYRGDLVTTDGTYLAALLPVDGDAAHRAAKTVPAPVRVPLAVLAARRPSVLARVLPVERESSPPDVSAFSSSI